MNSVIGDIRDFEYLKQAFDKAQPEIVLHLIDQLKDGLRITIEELIHLIDYSHP